MIVSMNILIFEKHVILVDEQARQQSIRNKNRCQWAVNDCMNTLFYFQCLEVSVRRRGRVSKVKFIFNTRVPKYALRLGTSSLGIMAVNHFTHV
jgi:adenine-specific DNA methylase